jgi:hypothetical protein
MYFVYFLCLAVPILEFITHLGLVSGNSHSDIFRETSWNGYTETLEVLAQQVLTSAAVKARVALFDNILISILWRWIRIAWD